MKIFILVGSLTSGGAERVASDMASGLSKRGHNVILYTDTNKPISYVPNDAVQVKKFEPQSIARCIMPIIKMSREIKVERPDVIIGICGYLTFLCKMAQILSGIKIPVIYSEHNSLERPVYAKLSIINKFYKFYFSRICSAMTVLTEADKKYVDGKLKNVYVMPNPLGILPCENVPVKENIILAVGRLSAWHYKGFDLLLAAWGNVCQKYPEWKLRIVGGGNSDCRNKLYQFAKQYNCENQFQLQEYTDNIIDFYQKSAIFVLSSRYEGFGLVVTEAMSQGCACIAANYKGRQSEIISNGIDGLLCETDNILAITEGIERLIDDSEFRANIQKSAITSSKRFSQEIYAEKWEQLLNRLTSN